jgi:hypothetical protein
MTAQELQSYIHIYSMFSFNDGRKEPGICINKYNIPQAKIEYYFIRQNDMQAYRNAFEKYDKETCKKLSTLIQAGDVINIRPVTLSDYKMIMEMLVERNIRINSQG